MMASEEKICEYFCENLAFWLPWQPISDLDKIHMFGRGLLKELIVFSKTFVKISAMR